MVARPQREDKPGIDPRGPSAKTIDEPGAAVFNPPSVYETGVVAQLVERHNGIVEVVGSIPIGSTSFLFLNYPAKYLGNRMLADFCLQPGRCPQPSGFRRVAMVGAPVFAEKTVARFRVDLNFVRFAQRREFRLHNFDIFRRDTRILGTVNQQHRAVDGFKLVEQGSEAKSGPDIDHPTAIK